MPLRALRKSIVAFAAFDSVAACRACATQNAALRQPEAAPPPERGADEQAAEGARSEHPSRSAAPASPAPQGDD
jgi:hypothetical protein